METYLSLDLDKVNYRANVRGQSEHEKENCVTRVRPYNFEAN
jgi:hypothetical protein